MRFSSEIIDNIPISKVIFNRNLKVLVVCNHISLNQYTFYINAKPRVEQYWVGMRQ